MSTHPDIQPATDEQIAALEERIVQLGHALLVEQEKVARMEYVVDAAGSLLAARGWDDVDDAAAALALALHDLQARKGP